MNSFTLLAALTLTLHGLFPSQASAQVRFIMNIWSGTCVDVSGAPGSANGTRLQIWNCELSGLNTSNGTPTDQRWEFLPGGFIRNTLSGKCIDVAGAPGLLNSAKLQLWDCELSGRSSNGAPSDQRWEITSQGFIRNLLSGRCIDIAGSPGSANGSDLQLWDCEYNMSLTDQKWLLFWY